MLPEVPLIHWSGAYCCPLPGEYTKKLKIIMKKIKIIKNNLKNKFIIN